MEPKKPLPPAALAEKHEKLKREFSAEIGKAFDYVRDSQHRNKDVDALLAYLRETYGDSIACRFMHGAVFYQLMRVDNITDHFTENSFEVSYKLVHKLFAFFSCWYLPQSKDGATDEWTKRVSREMEVLTSLSEALHADLILNTETKYEPCENEDQKNARLMRLIDLDTSLDKQPPSDGEGVNDEPKPVRHTLTVDWWSRRFFRCMLDKVLVLFDEFFGGDEYANKIKEVSEVAANTEALKSAMKSIRETTDQVLLVVELIWRNINDFVSLNVEPPHSISDLQTILDIAVKLDRHVRILCQNYVLCTPQLKDLPMEKRDQFVIMYCDLWGFRFEKIDSLIGKRQDERDREKKKTKEHAHQRQLAEMDPDRYAAPPPLPGTKRGGPARRGNLHDVYMKVWGDRPLLF